jgi:hypothetical protein
MSYTIILLSSVTNNNSLSTSVDKLLVTPNDENPIPKSMY